MAERKELYFESRDNLDKIHAMEWLPEGKPICVLQIIHGMAEHISCYDHFAKDMAKRGFLVVGNDHLGHGSSVSRGAPYGYFCKEEAATVVVRDVHRLKKIVQEENVGVPYFILGHSMGSFILRNYLIRYGKGIDGALIVGSGIQKRGMLSFGKAITSVLAVFQGWKHVSKIMDVIAFGAYNNRIKDKQTSFDWICTDKDRVDSYIRDEQCGFTFTLNGFHTLFTLIERVTGTDKLAAMPVDLPILLAAGAQDPVGAYGESIKKIYQEYVSLGLKDVTIKIYDEYRHEIMNETNKLLVYEDFYQWIISRLKEK